MNLAGFPHSEMSGSPFAANSPDLFAGNRVLLRPLAPRHPPCALCSLTYPSTQHSAERSDRVRSLFRYLLGETLLHDALQFVRITVALEAHTPQDRRRHGRSSALLRRCGACAQRRRAEHSFYRYRASE